MSILRASVLAFAVLSAAGAARAAPPVAPTQAPVAPTGGFAHGAKPITDAELQDYSGGAAAAVGMSEQQLTAIDTGNSVKADSVVNGSVNLSPGAFSGFSGLGNFVINTGNNNTLQGTMSVNIVMTPAQ
jgi:hypothetical protein